MEHFFLEIKTNTKVTLGDFIHIHLYLSTRV